MLQVYIIQSENAILPIGLAFFSLYFFVLLLLTYHKFYEEYQDNRSPK